MIQWSFCVAILIVILLAKDCAKFTRITRRLYALFLLTTMSVQVAMIPLSGASVLRNMLPFHLCSFTAVVTIPMLFFNSQTLFQFCWYIGMPGALLALIFPSYGYSPWPNLARMIFLINHSLIFMAPIFMRVSGVKPTRKGTWQTLIIANILMVGALIANATLNTNYMFLSAAPLGTPLAFLAKFGKVIYILLLELIACAFIWGSSFVCCRGERRKIT